MLKEKNTVCRKDRLLFVEYVYLSRKKMLQERLSSKRKLIFWRAMYAFSWKTFEEKDYYTSRTRH